MTTSKKQLQGHDSRLGEVLSLSTNKVAGLLTPLLLVMPEDSFIYHQRASAFKLNR